MGAAVDRPLKLRDLRRILRSFGVMEDSSKGKGSHTTFYLEDDDGNTIATYPVPTTRSDVLQCYIKGCRKRFHLRPDDDVSDKEFYSR
jgi:hypothetical protein